MPKIKVFIAEDQLLVRDGLRYILNVQEDIEVVGEAPNGHLAVSGISQTRPDVVLMDIRMPELDGIAATREVLRHHPELRVIVLTTFNQLDHVVDAIRAGAIGFLLKDAEAAQIVEGVRAAYRGEAFFRTEHAGLAMTTAVKSPYEETPEDDAAKDDSGATLARGGKGDAITERELEVLQEMAYGRRNSEIAQNLHVSEGTVKTHIHHILDKLGVEDRTQAVILALRSGLVK